MDGRPFFATFVNSYIIYLIRQSCRSLFFPEKKMLVFRKFRRKKNAICSKMIFFLKESRKN